VADHAAEAQVHVAPLTSQETSTTEPVSATNQRLLALDVFRGITIAGMLIVNNPGSWSAIYPPLEHAPWNGWTLTDLIFPFFLFIVGITTSISMSARRGRGASDRDLVVQILRRGLIIIALGLLLNAFPFYWWGKIDGNPDPTIFERMAYRIHYLRYFGVLQRIGIVYIAAALLALRTTLKQQVAIAASILVGYWLAMTLLPIPGTGMIGGVVLDQPDKTLAAYFDRLIIGENHIWRSTKTWDPEGPLSTFPAIVTAMFGIFAGRWISRHRTGQDSLKWLATFFAMGSCATVIGLMWSWVFPINKNLWTSSYVVFTAGLATLTLGICIWLIDVRAIRWWTRPFVIFGMNPIVAFVGSGVMARITDSLIRFDRGGSKVSLHSVIYERWFASWLAPRNASLVYALIFVLFWLGILTMMHRRKMFLKV
jgi:predicted acyltransferase